MILIFVNELRERKVRKEHERKEGRGENGGERRKREGPIVATEPQCLRSRLSGYRPHSGEAYKNVEVY
jgi:hypothetical protein